MKKNSRKIILISIILSVVLIITTYSVGLILSDLKITLMGFFGATLLLIILLFYKSFSYVKEKKWFYLVLILMLFISYSFLSINYLIIGVKGQQLYNERADLFDQYRLEEVELNRKELFNEIIELDIKISNLIIKYNLLGFMQHSTFLVIIIMPSQKNKDEKDIDKTLYKVS